MKRFRWIVHATSGAVLGTTLAVCLHVWQMSATRLFGMAPEGVAFNTYALAHVLGFPTNLLFSILVDYLPGTEKGLGYREYLLLLLGIVLNWAMLGWAVGLFKSRRA